MIGSMPMAPQGPGTLPPGFPGGVYPGQPTFQGTPAMGRPMYVQGPSSGAPAYQPAANPQPERPWLAQGPAFAPEAPQPKFRLQAPEDPPAPRRLSLPAPEDLGVHPPPDARVSTNLDWNAARAKLDQLGALSFRVDKLASGSHRVTLLLPTQSRDRTRQIETSAESEAAAVQMALEQAER